MASQRKISVVHKNDFSTYLGNWKNAMNIKLKMQSPLNVPAMFSSLSESNYDLSLMLAYLDDKLTVLEEAPPTPNQFNYQAYAEAKVFLKAVYLFFRILLDDVSGIIEYFYQKNEPIVEVTKSFENLQKKARDRKLPEDLSKLLERPMVWFPEMRKRRDNLVHHYESILITTKQGENGKIILGHFGIRGHTSKDYEAVRDYFGYLLCEYQIFIDNLLEHFDTKFKDWYGIIQGKSGRTVTIKSGCVALPLWWAYKYGNYKHEDLQVSEG